MISKCRTNLNHWDMCSFFCSEVRFRKWFPSRNCNASWILLLLCLFFSDVSWPHQFASNVCNTFQLTIQSLSKPYPNLYTVRQTNCGAFGIFRCSPFGFIFFYYFLIFLLSTFYVHLCMFSVSRLVFCLQHSCLSGCQNEWSFSWPVVLLILLTKWPTVWLTLTLVSFVLQYCLPFA